MDSTSRPVVSQRQLSILSCGLCSEVTTSFSRDWAMHSSMGEAREGSPALSSNLESNLASYLSNSIAASLPLQQVQESEACVAEGGY